MMHTLVLVAALGCEWPGFATAPAYTPEEGVVWMTAQLDEAFFKCARQAQGEARIVLLAGRPGAMKQVSDEAVQGARLQKGLYRSGACDVKPSPTHWQVRLDGKGALQPASFTSELMALPPDMCPGCSLRTYESSVNVRPAKRGVSVEVRIDPEWIACKERRGQMTLKLFTGASEEEVLTKLRPSQRVALPAAKAKAEVDVPVGPLCKGKPRFFAYEVLGEGDLRAMDSTGSRYAQPLSCP
jgi:hypothetical protein